jgi:hypothetical protein
MARFADRVVYRVAGLVWTAVYSGLCRRSSAGTTSTATYVVSDVSTAVQEPSSALAA